MKEIELTQGKTALVDDEDYERLSKHKWYAHNNGVFYAMRSDKKNRTTIQMHHEILGKPPIGMVTDHIDGNGLNNQRKNIHHVSLRGNAQNTHNKKSSNYLGVTFHKHSKRWMSQIGVGGKNKYLGIFMSEIDAHAAYRKAESEIAT